MGGRFSAAARSSLPAVAGALLVVFSLFGCTQQAETAARPLKVATSIAVDDLHHLIDADPETFILDVRTAGEYDGPLGHIDRARLIPVQELAQRMAELQDAADPRIHVVCRSGARSTRATKMLLEAGFDAVNVDGGMIAWRQLFPQTTE